MARRPRESWSFVKDSTLYQVVGTTHIGDRVCVQLWVYGGWVTLKDLWWVPKGHAHTLAKSLVKEG